MLNRYWYRHFVWRSSCISSCIAMGILVLVPRTAVCHGTYYVLRTLLRTRTNDKYGRRPIHVRVRIRECFVALFGAQHPGGLTSYSYRYSYRREQRTVSCERLSTDCGPARGLYRVWPSSQAVRKNNHHAGDSTSSIHPPDILPTSVLAFRAVACPHARQHVWRANYVTVATTVLQGLRHLTSRSRPRDRLLNLGMGATRSMRPARRKNFLTTNSSTEKLSVENFQSENDTTRETAGEYSRLARLATQ
eukprot:scaffold682043_cov39-Prasinocladus_malaysianus.AAC.1